jgi:hypothetical protein
MKLELIDWMFKQSSISIDFGDKSSPCSDEWCITLNPMNGTGPRFYHDKDFWQALQLAKDNYSY